MLYLGEISALIAAGAWAGASISVTRASKVVGSTVVNFGRLLFAELWLALAILIFQLPININERQILFLSLSGIIGLSLGDTALFKAYERVGPRIAMLISSISPAISAFLALLIFGESLSIIGVLGIVLTIGGISLVINERNSSKGEKQTVKKSGVIYAVIAALCQSVGVILAKQAYLIGAIHPLVATAARVLVALIFLYIAARLVECSTTR